VIWPLSLLVGLLVVLAITAATAWFVAQEFAYMSVDRSRLEARAASGDAGAERALAITRRTSFMLSGAQLGITVTGLLVGFVAEPLIGQAIGELLGGVSVPTGVGIAIGTVAALLLSTFIQMLIGELVPKNLSIAEAEPMAIGLSRSTRIYLAVFGWLITVFDRSSNLLLRALRIDPVHDVEHSATVRDLEHIVADSRESGDLPGEVSVLLDRILDFPAQDVEHAMVPRGRVGAVRPDLPLTEVRERMQQGHSRYPVLDDRDDGVEQVLGVVHLQDVLALDQLDGRAAADVMRPPLLLPTAMRLPDALGRLVGTRNQLACVLDEYGGFVGVLSAEDLAEELIGEIGDEHDPVARASTPDPQEGSWVVAGDLPVDEVARLIERPLPEGDYETIAGLAITERGTFPAVGDRLAVELPPDPAEYAHTDDPPPGRLDLEVLEIDHHVPSLVRITLPGPAAAADAATAPAGVAR
jgi:CBS domain containing-hemolysin-like protein